MAIFNSYVSHYQGIVLSGFMDQISRKSGRKGSLHPLGNDWGSGALGDDSNTWDTAILSMPSFPFAEQVFQQPCVGKHQIPNLADEVRRILSSEFCAGDGGPSQHQTAKEQRKTKKLPSFWWSHCPVSILACSQAHEHAGHTRLQWQKRPFHLNGHPDSTHLDQKMTTYDHCVGINIKLIKGDIRRNSTRLLHIIFDSEW